MTDGYEWENRNLREELRFYKQQYNEQKTWTYLLLAIATVSILIAIWS